MSNTNKADPWKDDVLGRDAYAVFLNKKMLQKCKKPKPEKPGTEKQAPDEQELCCCVLAIDDEWGTGKTFFVEAWQQDLENQDPPFHTLYFDAWAADCMADPLLALMAELQQKLLELLPEKHQAIRKTKKVFSKAVKTMLPVGISIGKHLAKKCIGGEAIEIFQENMAQKSTSPEAIQNATDEAVEAVFGNVLKAQSQQQNIVQAFKDGIAQTLQIIFQSQQQVQADPVSQAEPRPIVVFIDELDRCRPNFAVELLEGIKHLFDIPGLCFVISTNTNQLAETIKGAYGSNFDGKRYLDRLFDARFALPKPTTDQYCQLLAKRHRLGKDGTNQLLPRIDWGVPVHPDNSQYKDAGSIFAWVAKVFDLDLRTQEKVFNRMMDAAEGLPEGYRLQFLFMAVLATLAHVAPEIFDELETKPLGFSDQVDPRPFKFDDTVVFKFNDLRNKHHPNYEYGTTLHATFMAYVKILHEEILKVDTRLRNQTSPGPYPDAIVEDFAEKEIKKRRQQEMERLKNTGRHIEIGTQTLSLKLYFPLLRHAGFLHSNH